MMGGFDSQHYNNNKTKNKTKKLWRSLESTLRTLALMNLMMANLFVMHLHISPGQRWLS